MSLVRHSPILLLALGATMSAVVSKGLADEDLQRRIDAAKENAVVTVPVGTVKTPLTIARPLILKGQDAEKCILEVTADRPALRISGKGPMVVEDLTIKWQLATSDGRRAEAAALLAKDTDLILKNCRLIALGTGKRCPTAVAAVGFSNVRLQNCQLEGFEFTIAYVGGAQGAITDCAILNPGHCGATVYSGSTMEVARCIVTGSKYHGLRCTGGTINAHDNLIIANKNRGVYLGNKAASGRISNNVISANGTGVSAFGGSSVTIENNLFLDCSFCGLDARDSCPITVRDNLFQGNTSGLIQFAESGRSQIALGPNCFWMNGTNSKDINLPQIALSVDPRLAEPEKGKFAVMAKQVASANIGLSDSEVFVGLWQKWEKLAR